MAPAPVHHGPARDLGLIPTSRYRSSGAARPGRATRADTARVTARGWRPPYDGDVHGGYAGP
ncbi:hypothetical protein [Streptomyces sp. NPDC017202]|uniref:hypothetical protein n=1 Tax=Streptomyces sp. NPDC017202 TaxID=3364981 RepID=UPI0037A88DD6